MPKRSLPLSKVYSLIEPGPVVLLTTAAGGEIDLMPMSWHSMLEFDPPLIGCVVSDRNHSFALLQASGECVINIPTVDIAARVVACGNCSGAKVDKVKRFGFTTRPATLVQAPLIDECFASLECRVADASMVPRYSMFVLQVVKAWIDPRLKQGRTLHHIAYGRFMGAGDTFRPRSRMR